MILIYHASNITEAHIIKGMLQNNGINAYVGGHYLQGGAGELPVTDIANIHVPDEDVDLARTLLKKYEQGEMMDNNFD